MASDRDALQERIRTLFIGELDDALGMMNATLLRLEAAAGSPAEGDLVRELFRVAHSIKGAAHAANVPAAAGIAHDLEEAFAAIRDGATSVDEDVIATVLRLVDALAATRPDAPGPAAVSAPAAPEPSGAPPPAVTTVRVQVGKLDALVDRASDLIGLSGRLTAVAQVAAERHGAGGAAGAAAGRGDLIDDVTQTARELSRLSVQLANAAVALTFQSFGDACDGLERVVHDLARAGAKQARLDIVGGDVEIDRSVIAAIREPLLHLVRNAVDHGIERPAERRAAGKAELGRIAVEARLHGSQVDVTVEDDGRGVDHAAVQAAARQQGLASTLVEEELVFAPGITTAPSVTDVSGRGVGLDAVRARVEGFGGTVRLTARPGGGTVVTLTAPVSLALLQVLVVRVARETLCLPLAVITRLVTAEPDEVRDVDGTATVTIDGSTVPVVPLQVAAGLPGAAPLRAGPLQLVVVEARDHRVALAVDAFVGEADIVAKRPPARLARLDTILGTTTLVDGRAALILNVRACVGNALQHRSALPAVAAPPPARRPRILVADDTVTTRALEVGILEAAGYDVLPAGDGREAWKLLRQHGADLVLTDVHMPDVDGIALCRLIRESVEYAELPIVIVTSLGSDDDRRRGLEAGASAYIVKSQFDQDTLLDVIERSL